MDIVQSEARTAPRIEYLRVINYRVLRDLELKNITPLTVFLVSGFPRGCGAGH